MEENFLKSLDVGGDQRQKPVKTAVLEFLKFIFIVGLIVVPVRMWVAQPFMVSGASMEPTYDNGDYLIIDELSYHLRSPRKDEVVVFRYPKKPSIFYIKRIIGLPNDELEIDGKKIKLNKDEYFVMGDNRDNSSDSRVWGPVPEKFMVGRSLARLWPVKKIGLFPGY